MMQNSAFNLDSEVEERLVFLEDQLRDLTDVLNGFFLKGRLRTDRGVPANSADVNAADQLYDLFYTPTLAYVLINNAGTIEWRSITLSVF
jgi:hypothetical protein